MKPIARTTLTADICRKLTEHLINGDWKEGDRLPSERDLCAQLGVGRASLREALKALEIMGMIEIRLGEGTFVCARTEFLSRPLIWAITTGAAEARELVEARALMETELAALAALRATDKDLEEMARCVGRMEEACGDLEAFLSADLAFHVALAQAAHNRILRNALELTRNLTRQWIAETLERPGVYEQAVRLHRDLLEAISRHDAPGAREAMKTHMRAAVQAVPKLRGLEDEVLSSDPAAALRSQEPGPRSKAKRGRTRSK